MVLQAGGRSMTTGLLRGVGAQGKLPCHGDFLRYDVDGPGIADLSRWLAATVDNELQARRPPLSNPVAFVFRTPRAEATLVGLMHPSRDLVGRQYPFVVYAALSGPGQQSIGAAALATGFVRFLGDAAVLCENAVSGADCDLVQGLAGLVAPCLQDVSEVGQGCRVDLEGTTLGDLSRDSFDDAPLDVLAHAFYTLAEARRQVHDGSKSAPGLTVECPAPSSGQRAVWLEMIERLLGRQGAGLSCFWPTDESGRLLVCIDGVSKLVLRFLGDPQCSASKLWPVHCTDAKLLQMVSKALTPTQRAVLSDPSSTLSAALAVL